MLKAFNDDLFVCGVDEVGRGSLAGPVTAAAVILPKNYKNKLIKDSKKLNTHNRMKLYDEITSIAIDYSIIDIPNDIIDSINVLESTFLAMNKAISKIIRKADYIIIDGNQFKTKSKFKYECVVRGDSIYQSIAAASILAKVHRDKLMVKYNKEYPYYDWINNKGYGTIKHQNAIKKFGISIYHRKSFNLLNKQLKIKI
jgi:ribonuclease HII